MFAQLFACDSKNQRGQHIFHTLGSEEAAICCLPGLVAGAAPDVAFQNGRVPAHRTGERGISWTVNCDQRRSDRACYMHRSAIAADKQVRAFEQGR